MKPLIHKCQTIGVEDNLILLGDQKSSFKGYGLSEPEYGFVRKKLEELKAGKAACIPVNQYSRWIVVQVIPAKENSYGTLEACRRLGNDMAKWIREQGIGSVTIADVTGKTERILAFAEGMALGSYRFLKYKQGGEDEKNPLKTIVIAGKEVHNRKAELLEIITDATWRARDLVNEPHSWLTAGKLAEEIQRLGREAGFGVEVFGKKKIEALKMGGLLAVNRGSSDPPTFTVLEWNPPKAKNKNPFVLVGKGIVFDTGGLSLKPTEGSMDAMKSDMSGAAAVACTFFAVAKAQLPVHLIGLVPATDNRPSGNAYVPGDVITMHNGLTVEVLNTDAEGRMVLADALSFATKYNPELVIDVATLTSSAARAIGHYGMVAMRTADDKYFRPLVKSGNHVYERLVEFPFWDEYYEMIKSNVADLRNIGTGKNAGAIVAGKFLERFTDYPWIHLDIAGMAFLTKADGYRVKGGTGVGVRLLFDFLGKLSFLT